MSNFQRIGAIYPTLAEACAVVGIAVPRALKGRYTAIQAEDDRRGKAAGRVYQFPDGRGCAVMNWKTGVMAVVVYGWIPGQHIDRRELARLKAEAERARAAEWAREQACRKKAAAVARSIVEASRPYLGDDVHGYLRLKQIAFAAPSLLEISKEKAQALIAAGVLLFSSYRYLASGMAAVFHFAYPVIVVLGGLLLREQVKKRALFCALLCSLGIALLIDPRGAIDPLGVTLALSSGVTYAVYILLLGHFRHREVSGFRLSFYMAFISSVCTLPLCLITHQFRLPQTVGGWGVAIFFSLTLCVGAVVLFQKGTFLIGAQRAAILSTFEPITSIFAGILFLHETLTLRILLGSSLTLLASVLITTSGSESTDDPE